MLQYEKYFQKLKIDFMPTFRKLFVSSASKKLRWHAEMEIKQKKYRSTEWPWKHHWKSEREIKFIKKYQTAASKAMDK